MKLFILGALIMYLLCSELIVLSIRNDWGLDCDRSLIMWILCFPQSLFYFLGNKIYCFYNNWNVKPIVYDAVEKKWYKTEKGFYDKAQEYYKNAYLTINHINDANKYYILKERSEHSLFLTYYKEFKKFYKYHPHWSRYMNHRQDIDTVHVPKSVWKHFDELTIEIFTKR